MQKHSLYWCMLSVASFVLSIALYCLLAREGYSGETIIRISKNISFNVGVLVPFWMNVLVLAVVNIISVYFIFRIVIKDCETWRVMAITIALASFFFILASISFFLPRTAWQTSSIVEVFYAYCSKYMILSYIMILACGLVKKNLNYFERDRVGLFVMILFISCFSCAARMNFIVAMPLMIFYALSMIGAVVIFRLGQSIGRKMPSIT